MYVCIDLQAILGKAVEASQRHVVEVEAKSYLGDLIRFPVFSLTMNKKDMVDLMTFMSDTVTIFAARGSDSF